jgi:hypothetical protein
MPLSFLRSGDSAEIASQGPGVKTSTAAWKSSRFTRHTQMFGLGKLSGIGRNRLPYLDKSWAGIQPAGISAAGR